MNIVKEHYEQGASRADQEIKQHCEDTQENKQIVSDLKAKLKCLLIKHHGSTKHRDVLDVIDELSKHNPSRRKEEGNNDDNIFNSPIFCGDYVTATAPNFPGRIRKGNTEDVVQYTLGRLSFNIFQPAKLVCTLRTVRNLIFDEEGVSNPQDGYSTASLLSSTSSQREQQEGKKEERKFTYYILCEIIIHTPNGDLPAVLRNEGVCYPSDKSKNMKDRFMVAFSGGTLMPAKEASQDAAKLKLWEETFEGAYAQADKERSFTGGLFLSLMKLLLGLSLPTDDDDMMSSQHSFHFDMKRAPVGFADVMFFDEDIRITKGNKGTIVIAERDTKNEK